MHPCCVSRPSGVFCASSRHSSRTEPAIAISPVALAGGVGHDRVMATATRTQRRYDHRLRNLVRTTRDIDCAIQRGVPRSTARGWLTDSDVPVVTVEALNLDATCSVENRRENLCQLASGRR